MSKRRKWLLIPVFLFVSVALLVILSRDPEPSYQGHTLRQYVEWYDLYYGSRDTAVRKQAADGIQHIGTNAIPYLLKWIQFDEPIWESRLREKIPGRLGNIYLYSRGTYQANLTIHAFRALGPDADAAIGELTRLANGSKSEEVAKRAIYALGFMGRTNAMPPLIGILNNPHALLRDTAAYALDNSGEAAQPAVPVLITCLKDKDEAVVREAAWSLGWLKLDPELVVPRLIAALDDPRPKVQESAAFALNEYGAAAKSAIPALLKATHSPNVNLTELATKALLAIQPEALTNAPAR